MVAGKKGRKEGGREGRMRLGKNGVKNKKE
jgi:hypothetical protein